MEERFLSTITPWAASVFCPFWDEYTRSVHVWTPCFCLPPWPSSSVPSSVPTTNCFWTRCSWSFWDGPWTLKVAQHLPIFNGTTDDFYHKEDDPTSFEENQEFEFEKEHKKSFYLEGIPVVDCAAAGDWRLWGISSFVQEAKSFVKLNTWTYSVSCLICFVSGIAISCCRGVF